MSVNLKSSEISHLSWMERYIRFCVEKKVAVFLIIFLIAGWGILVSPFD